MEKYDPNEAHDLGTVHVVELTFQCWQYRKTETRKVGGNVAGFDNIETAIGSLYDDVPENEIDGIHIILTAENGDTLTVSEEGRGEDFLKDILVAARIVGVEPKAE